MFRTAASATVIGCAHPAHRWNASGETFRRAAHERGSVLSPFYRPLPLSPLASSTWSAKVVITNKRKHAPNAHHFIPNPLLEEDDYRLFDLWNCETDKETIVLQTTLSSTLQSIPEEDEDSSGYLGILQEHVCAGLPVLSKHGEEESDKEPTATHIGTHDLFSPELLDRTLAEMQQYLDTGSDSESSDSAAGDEDDEEDHEELHSYGGSGSMSGFTIPEPAWEHRRNMRNSCLSMLDGELIALTVRRWQAERHGVGGSKYTVVREGWPSDREIRCGHNFLITHGEVWRKVPLVRCVLMIEGWKASQSVRAEKEIPRVRNYMGEFRWQE